MRDGLWGVCAGLLVAATGCQAVITDGDFPPPAPAAVRGTVAGPAARAYVTVLAREGVLAEGWSTPDEKRYEFRDLALPGGTAAVVVVAWAPNPPPPAAESLLPALGTADYSEQFDWWYERAGQPLWAGRSVSVDLEMQPSAGLEIDVVLTGLDPDRPLQQAWVQLMHLNDDGSEAHTLDDTLVERIGPSSEHPLLRGGPHRIGCPCACGVRFRVRARVAGYRPYEAIVPMPTGPGVAQIEIPMAPLDHGTHGRAVDADTGTPLAGALLVLLDVPERDGIPGLGPMQEFPLPGEWMDLFTIVGETDADGRFALDARLYDAPLVAMVPGERCSQTIDLRSHRGPVELRMGPGHAITGTVRDATTDAPVADAHVTLIRYAPTEGATAGPPARIGDGGSVQADGDGRFRIGGLPHGAVIAPEAVAAERIVPIATTPSPLTGAAGVTDVTVRVHHRRGVVVHHVLRPPKERAQPESVDVVHVHEVDRPSRAGDRAGVTERDVTDDLVETVTVEMGGGRTRVTTRRAHTAWLHDGRERHVIRLFLAVGLHTISFAAEGFAPVTLPARKILTADHDEQVVVGLQPR